MAALALLVVGGIALVNALTSSSDKAAPPPGASASASKAVSPGAKAPESSAGGPLPLVIKGQGGKATFVTITVAGSNEVLYHGLLNPGEGRQYAQAPLNVVANDGGLVQVTIYGKAQARPAGQRGEWFVPAKG
ncbi:hypothetical protein [Actinomadura parmotrematis]|uniref:hypothetical protein n=1 Tax=Actinomadura parmotrematis TaxID=2864039 RepID=UPI0027E327C7|nr:hypothetical protein [Actinomadura parmotrematis]